MKYILLICFFVFFFEKGYSQKLTQNTFSNCDTSYVLLPSIKESCENIVFTDSMYRAWNTASVENAKEFLQKDSNACLEWLIPQFIKGENTRLLFCKMLNDISLITNKDFKKGFFIIEEIFNGSEAHTWNYLIVDREYVLKMYSYKLFKREFIWDLREEKTINERKFYNFLSTVKKCKKNEVMYPDQFIVTKFTDKKIESFVFACGGCRKCISRFYKLTGRDW